MGGQGAGVRRGKLTAGVRVALLHPGWDRPCVVCEAYRPREDGSFVLDKRTALPLARVPGTPTPCHKCPKLPAAARESGAGWQDLRALAADLTDANRAALAFYRRCRATGRFPDDPLVSWYAGLIRDVEDAADRADRASSTSAIVAALLIPRR
jgi:hypothetical protein